MTKKFVILNERQVCDLEMILTGAFEPLKGFMNEEDYKGVVEDMRLKSNILWPLPVTLSLQNIKDYSVGEEIILCDKDNAHLASMVIESIYVPDLQKECIKCYGSDDTNHPYVNIILNQGKVTNIGGTVMPINGVSHYDYTELRLTPEEVKKTIKENNWKTVVGFQTRNPMHRSHFELTQKALRDSGDKDAVLFLNPVVGITQECDIDYHTRVKCYKALMPRYNEKAMLSLLPLSMRMAGPKEALLHAIVRKNYGCTHFIVGRDHAGPSYKTKEGNSFYGPYEAQELLQKHAEEINIVPLTSKMMVYVKNKEIYLPMDETTSDDNIDQISGTQQRKMLENNEPIPEWFTFSEISEILQKEYKPKNQQGFCVYIVGLSGSGKTTIANALREVIYEKTSNRTVTILDGDVVRQNLSKGLGFSREDRSTNVRRIGYVASEIVKHNGIVLCANIAPYEEDRAYNRQLISQYGHYIEVYMNTPLTVCEDRDVKGLYALARNGVIKEFTGISDPFNVPSLSELELTHSTSITNSVQKIMNYLISKELF
jgi:sulfate adenylyltransferase